MRRETLKTNKTVVAELELEAPFSAKQKGVLHNSDRSFFPHSIQLLLSFIECFIF
jgi:hypothetical protein